MSRVFFYDPATGELHPHVVQVNNPDMIANLTPPGFIAAFGEAQPHFQRFDLVEKKLVADDAKSAKNADIEKRTTAMRRIRKLEDSQHRSVREATLGLNDAVARLRAIDEEISSLRRSLL
jgi:hypothetical protein